MYQTSSWTEHGATSRMIVELARQRDLPVCILHGEKLVECYPGAGKPIFVTIHQSHAYFYRGMHARRQLMKRKPCDFTHIAREVGANKTPDASQWRLYEDLAPGHWYVPDSELENVRGQLLATGRHPKVTEGRKQDQTTDVYLLRYGASAWPMCDPWDAR